MSYTLQICYINCRPCKLQLVYRSTFDVFWKWVNRCYPRVVSLSMWSHQLLSLAGLLNIPILVHASLSKAFEKCLKELHISMSIFPGSRCDTLVREAFQIKYTGWLKLDQEGRYFTHFLVRFENSTLRDSIHNVL